MRSHVVLCTQHIPVPPPCRQAHTEGLSLRRLMLSTYIRVLGDLCVGQNPHVTLKHLKSFCSRLCNRPQIRSTGSFVRPDGNRVCLADTTIRTVQKQDCSETNKQMEFTRWLWISKGETSTENGTQGRGWSLTPARQRQHTTWTVTSWLASNPSITFHRSANWECFS